MKISDVVRRAGLTSLLCLALAACTSSSPGATGPAVDPLETNAVNALTHAHVEQADDDLDAALARYQRLDDLAGEWRIHYLKASIALARGDTQAASVQAAALDELTGSLDSTEARYRTALVKGRVANDPAQFQAALGYATTSLEKALAETYLGNTAHAITLLDDKDDTHPADRAFVYYRRAIDTHSAALFQKALTDYRRANDSRGVADTLVNLAHISAADGQVESARDYARRALRVLVASGDDARADSVRAWLESL